MNVDALHHAFRTRASNTSRCTTNSEVLQPRNRRGFKNFLPHFIILKLHV